MVSFNTFSGAADLIAEGVVSPENCTFSVVLTDSMPSAGAKGIAEIADGNGYAAGGVPVAVTKAEQAGDAYRLVVADWSITASGGSIGPFRYLALVASAGANPSKGVVGWWDNGSSITLWDGETFSMEFRDAVPFEMA